MDGGRRGDHACLPLSTAPHRRRHGSVSVYGQEHSSLADYRAIAAVSEAVIELLQARYTAEPNFFNNQLEFRVYLAKDFAQPMAAGVSVFLYRIYPNGTVRTPRGRPGPAGQRYRNQLPLDL